MVFSSSLNHWAVIDIETTGVDPAVDEIIDIGFLQFQGIKLIKKYSTLVHYSGELSHFIQKLTGITGKMLEKAPESKDMKNHVLDLCEDHLICHNADFERSFLEGFTDGKFSTSSYEDSLLYLALLFPKKDSLSLERFLVDWGISKKESHRGLDDSIGLLKVLILATLFVQQDKINYFRVKELFQRHGLEDYWYYHFFTLSEKDLFTIAEQIDFCPQSYLQNMQPQVKHENDKNEKHHFSMEFSRKNLENIYNSQIIGEVLPRFQKRKAQMELSFKTGQSFKNDVHALVQAPTGTGKTLGYLLPGALFALSEGGQVLISTGTKILQDQIMMGEIPQVRKLLGIDADQLSVTKLVGSKNHFCELLYREQEKHDFLSRTRTFEDRFVGLFFGLVFLHNAGSSYDDKILNTHLPYVLKKKLRSFKQKTEEIIVDFRSCIGSQCPFGRECSYLTGIREARNAKIIVSNHSLMFSWPKGLPRPEYIIVDEAHKIEEEATRSCAFEWSQNSIESFVKNLKNLSSLGSLFQLLSLKYETRKESLAIIESLKTQTENICKTLETHLLPLKILMERYFKETSVRYSDVFWNELPMVNKKQGRNSLEVSVYNHIENIRDTITELYNVLLPYAVEFKNKEELEKEHWAYATHFETFVGIIEDMKTELDVFVDKKEGFSCAFRYHEKEGYTLYSAPIDIGRILHDNLLDTGKSILFTSATLGNAKGDQGVRGIEWATGHGYLNPKKRFKKGFFLPPVFDYKSNAKIYLCDDVLPLYDPLFVRSTLEKVLPLIKNIAGRGLFLFSAKKRFQEAREFFLEKLWGEMPVFVQGMGGQVVEDFRRAGTGILLGMESFGEGIDVPGDALQFLFIDKIPDMRKNLVTVDRQKFYGRKFGNEFIDYYLSHRARSLHQKLGRLLRSEKDYGGAVIVDSRISRWKETTVENFLGLMAPYHIERCSLNKACMGLEHFLKIYKN